MTETVEYLSTIIETFTFQPLSGAETVWHAGETVIIREVKDIRYYRIMKLHDREIGVVTRSKVFKYYDPEWLEISGK